jgi:glycosyltransferase involved in cell wall biosynthesis
MRICIDARMMGPENTRGIGRYIEELIRAMLELEPDNRYILIVRKPDHPFKDHPSVETLVADIQWYGLAEQFKMSEVFRQAKADLVHVPHWNVPIFYRGPLVITIHDLLLRHFPLSAKTSTRAWPMRLAKRLLYRVVVANAVGRARRILVPTECVKSDVESFYPSAKGKISLTGEGMPPLSADNRLPPADYLLYVGSAYPHKGLDDLLAAWPKLHGRHPELELKLAGEQDVFMRRMMARAESENLVGVDFLGKVSDEQLKRLYSGAVALIFPTHFEGFGLPPFEALAQGCPVIASDIPVLQEVLGENGATYFRLGDSDGILAAVESVLAQPEKSRSSAREAAARLMRRHTWQGAAEKTFLAYGQASSSLKQKL